MLAEDKLLKLDFINISPWGNLCCITSALLLVVLKPSMMLTVISEYILC